MNTRLFRLASLLSSFFFAITFSILLITGCTKQGSEVGKVVATVNEESIKLEDFQREIALRSKQNPSYKVTPQTIDEQLHTIIDRRLMIQEATKMGLVNNKDFVRTIQTFWEQTLIRELMKAKSHEWEDRIFVTEQEVRDYYKKMRSMVTFSVIRVKEKADAGRILEKAKQGAPLQWETVGPVNYADNLFGIFNPAFDVPEGGKGILENEAEFIVYSVEKREPVDLPPYEKLYGQIKNRILEQKRIRALDEWLKDVREKSDIEIDRKIIESYLNASTETGQTGGDGVE